MRRLYQLVFRNLDLKLAGLLLAVVTWYYLATAGLDQRRFPGVAVRVLNVPENLALLSLDVQNVTLTLRGPRSELDTLSSRELFVVVDVGELALPGTLPFSPSIAVTNRHVRVGRDAATAERLRGGVSLASADPATITMTLDTLREVVLDVEVVTAGRPAPGLTLRKRAFPSRATVRGASRLLERISAIRTEPIRVDGLCERLRRRVRLRREVVSPDYGRAPINPDPPEVEVVLDVVETPAEKAVDGVPIRPVGLAKDAAILGQDAQSAAVRLRGPQRLLDALDAGNLILELDLSGAKTLGEGPKEIAIGLGRANLRQLVPTGSATAPPADLEVLEVQPQRVRLTLDRLATRSLPVKAVLEGQPAEDHEVTETRTIPEEVAVSGPESVIKTLEAIPTRPVSIAGLAERLRRTVPLALKVDVGRWQAIAVEPDRREVDVVVTVSERRATKTLKGLPIRLLVKPELLAGIRVEMEPRETGPVSFVGPQSRIAVFSEDSVGALVRLEVTSAADLRPTIRNVEFHIRDPKVRLAPGAKPIPVKLEFPAAEAPPRKPRP